MARYGSGSEDLNREAEELKKLLGPKTDLAKKEAAYGKELKVTSGLEDDAAIKARRRAQARREAAELAKRGAAVAEKATGAINVDTAAIERNTRAVRANIAAQAQRRKLSGSAAAAVAGARDPSFPAAYQLAQASGGSVTQYRIRQQLQGVGSRRAAALQEALSAGFRPTTGPQAAYAPITRVQAADLEILRAKKELAERTRDLAQKVGSGKGGVTPEESTALAARDAAKRRVDAASEELKSARSQATERQAAAKQELEARERHTAALRKEAVERERLAQQAAVDASKGRELIRHPTLYQGGVGTGLPDRPRPTGFPRQVRDVGPSVGGGDEAYDKRFAANRAAAEAQRVAAEATQRRADAAQKAATAIDNQRLAEAQLQASEVDKYLAGSADAQNRQNRALQASGVSFGTVSNAMHRHGALTTEFINAAARGETTLKELGNQSIATAGKFAGWTAAGAALYTAVDAVRQLGLGAIKSSDGVAQLQRVIPGADRDQTISAFSDLSREFNVPVDVAADAVYRMGQRFHELPDAVEAARSALFSFKTGEVDVATSTSNLLAIVNGFGLGAKELSQVYDQINQAQNKFGIGIADTEAGLAKAGGAFRNSGGDLSFLLGLFVAISRATNRSGQEIGTGLARGVSQIRIPQHQEALVRLGVDVDPENLQSTIQSALKVVAANPNADVNAISSQILGNQYARLLAPVLADQTNLNNALKETSPEASKGSAQKELAKVLTQVSEQAQQVGNALQRIGAELARSGALTPFVGALKTLNLMLDTTGQLIKLFNLLPSPIRESVAILGEMALVVGLLRKFGATDRLAGGPLGFLSNPDKRLKTFAVKGLRDAQNEGYRELESAARREYRAATEAAATRQRATQFEKSPAFLASRNLPIDDDQRIATQNEYLGLQNEANAAERRRIKAAQETYLISEGVKFAERELLELKKLEVNQVRARLIQQGVVLPRQLDAPSTKGVQRLSGTNAAVGNLAQAAAGPTRSPLDRVSGGRPETPRADRVATSLRNSLNLQVARFRALSSANRELGYSGRLVEAAGRGAIAATAGAVAFTERAAASVKSTGGRMRQFGRSLGVLDLALIAYIGGEIVNTLVDKLNKDVDEAQALVDGYTGKSEKAKAELEARAAQIREKGAQTEGQYRTDNLERLNDIFNPVELFGKTLPAIAAGTYETPAARRARVAQEVLLKDEERQVIERNQQRARAAGRPVPQLTSKELVSQVRQAAADRRDGLINQREFDKIMARSAIEAKALLYPSKEEQRAANQAIADAQRVGGGLGYADSLSLLDAKGLQTEIDAVTAQIDAYGGSADDLTKLRQNYNAAVNSLGASSKAEDIKDLAAIRNEVFKVFAETYEKEIEVGLAGTRTEGGRRSVFNEQIQRARQIAGLSKARLTRASSGLQAARQRQREAQAALAQGPTYDPQQNPLGGVIPGLPGSSNLGKLRNEAKAAQAEVEKFLADKSKFRRELKAARVKLAEIIQKLVDASYDDREQGREITLAYKQSLTTDPLQQAALAVESAARQARDALSKYGGGSRKRLEALTKLNEAQKQEDAARSQDTQDRIRLQGELAAARAGGDAVAVARAGIAAARNALANAKTGNERLQALVDLANANNELEQAVRDREVAKLDLLASKTTDPVELSKIELRKARAALKGTKGTARDAAQADVNRRQQDLLNTQLESKQDDIDFERTLGRISVQDAIDRYQALLSVRTLTKQQKRDIELKIHALQEEAKQEASGFDLDVGGLKLPTVYDVRRAQDPIRAQVTANIAAKKARAAGSQVTVGPDRFRRTGADTDLSSNVTNLADYRAQSTVNNVTINIRGGNPAEIYAALDRALKTNIKAKARSRGRR